MKIRCWLLPLPILGLKVWFHEVAFQKATLVESWHSHLLHRDWAKWSEKWYPVLSFNLETKVIFRRDLFVSNFFLNNFCIIFMLRNGVLTSYPQINRWIKSNFTLLLDNSPKNKIMKVLQWFPGNLWWNFRKCKKITCQHIRFYYIFDFIKISKNNV